MTASDHSYESPQDRAGLAREAGLGRLSFPSILAGVLVAYGAFAVLAALAGTVATAIGLNTDLAGNDWATLGLGSAIAVAVVLLAAYLFGGYVAGRMARRAGLLNGLAVFLLALLLVAVSLRSRPARPTPRRSAATCAASASLPLKRMGQGRHRGRDRVTGRHAGRRPAGRRARRALAQQADPARGSGKYRPGRDDQPAERDHNRPPAHDQTLDQRDQPTPDRKDETGATRLNDPANKEAAAERVSRPRHDS